VTVVEAPGARVTRSKQKSCFKGKGAGCFEGLTLAVSGRK
jgi:hypothetical protein